MDTSGSTGAKSGVPSASNALAQTTSAGSEKKFATPSLTAGQAYPLRIQFGNAPMPDYNPSYLDIQFSTNDEQYFDLSNGAGGSFYYYPISANSPTSPGF